MHIIPARVQHVDFRVSRAFDQSWFNRWKLNSFRNFTQLCSVNSFTVLDLFSIDQKEKKLFAAEETVWLNSGRLRTEEGSIYHSGWTKRSVTAGKHKCFLCYCSEMTALVRMCCSLQNSAFSPPTAKAFLVSYIASVCVVNSFLAAGLMQFLSVYDLEGLYLQALQALLMCFKRRVPTIFMYTNQLCTPEQTLMYKMGGAPL